MPKTPASTAPTATAETVFEVMLLLPGTTKAAATALIEPIRKGGEAWINVWKTTRRGTTLRLISWADVEADARDEAAEVLDIIRRMGGRGSITSVTATREDEIE